MTGKSGRDSFDPQNFLAKVGVGKTISKFSKDQIIFSQGEAADAVFYIQKGRVKVVGSDLPAGVLIIELEMMPALLLQQIAGEIVLVQPLHHHDDRISA